MKYQRILNNIMDRVNHLHIKIFNRFYPAYKVCGCAGYILGCLLGVLLAVHTGLSAWMLMLLCMSAAVTFYSLAMVTKIILGEERLVYYHHEVVILLMSAIMLLILNQPVLPYLDIVVLGLGVFLACGRVGCLMVGCCHGKPHQWGICYGHKHVEKGFTNYFQGIRLFPVQALEILWVLTVTGFGVMMLLKRYPPGEAFTFYVMAYGTGRFFFEFLRGDPERPYWLGFSEAQWTTIVLMCLVLGMEWFQNTNFHFWYLLVCLFCLFIMIVLSGIREIQPSRLQVPWLPYDLKDFAAKLNDTVMYHIIHDGLKSEIPVLETRQDIRISADRIVNKDEYTFFYSISHKYSSLSLKAARKIGKMIQRLKHSTLPFRVVCGGNNVFHIVFQGIIFKSKKKKTIG